jgi:CelD/BcsL family acetyltransferase involved in cellulose biosynthesis
MQIKIYNNFSQELLKEFDKYINEFEYFPFQDLNWLKHWYETIASKEKILLKIFIIYDEGIPILILPFCIKNFLTFNILEWAGGLCSDYHGPIINKNFNKIDKAFFNKLWERVKKEFSNIDIIHLQKQKKFKNISNPFIEYFKNSVFHHKAYQINFSHSLSPQKEKKIKKVILDNKRQYKRISKFGSISFQDPNDKYQKKLIISKMIEQKETRYIQTNTWNMFSKKKYKDFYYGLPDVDFKELEVSVSTLISKNEFIACHVGLVHRNIFYYLMPSFDFLNWSVFSPGNILLEHLINKSQNKNLNFFDFTIGGEEYKKKWTNEEINLYEHLSAKSIKGFFYLSIYIFLIFLKKNIFFNFFLKKISIKIKSWLN